MKDSQKEPQQERERIPVHFNQAYFQAVMTNNEDARKILNAISREYDALSIGKVTKERMKQVLDSHYEGIKSDIEANVKENISRAKIDNKAMIGVITERVYDSFNDFELKSQQLVEKFKNVIIRPALPFNLVPVKLDHFTITDGNFHLTEGDIARIKDEYCTSWVDSDFKHRVYDSLVQVKDILNGIKRDISAANVGIQIFDIPAESDNNRQMFVGSREKLGFFIEDEEEIVINGKAFGFEL